MKVTVDLDKLDFIDIGIKEGDEINEVSLTCGTAQASYASNKSIDECATHAFRLLLRSLLDVNESAYRLKDNQSYNRWIAKSTII